MSRVGKKPVVIPAGVSVEGEAGRLLVKGPKGEVKVPVLAGVDFNIDAGMVEAQVRGTSRQARANYGTFRALINNAVIGVTQGWERRLELSGVGFNARTETRDGETVLVLAVGFSHDVIVQIPEEVQVQANSTQIVLTSVRKEMVSQLAAQIRDVQPPEPYLGKGIKYHDEVVRRKAGKAGKAK